MHCYNRLKINKQDTKAVLHAYISHSIVYDMHMVSIAWRISKYYCKNKRFPLRGLAVALGRAMFQ